MQVFVGVKCAQNSHVNTPYQTREVGHLQMLSELASGQSIAITGRERVLLCVLEIVFNEAPELEPGAGNAFLPCVPFELSSFYFTHSIPDFPSCLVVVAGGTVAKALTTPHMHVP